MIFMRNCKQTIASLDRIDHTKNPFTKFEDDSGISDNDITTIETSDRWSIIVKGSWGFSTEWFPKKTDFEPLADGIHFYVYKK